MTATITIGTVSHGTLRTADLLEAFADTLANIASTIEAGDPEICHKAFDRVQALTNGADETEADSELVAELQDALDALAPAGMYFGNTEGDGSDFGWWPTEAGRRAAMATEMAAAFETRTRDNGDSFVCLKDGSPEWMSDVCHDGHGSMLPDDYRYRMIRDAMAAIAETLADDCDADLADVRSETVDGMVSVYHADRFRWLASRGDRADYCDQAREEGLVSEDASISDRIAAGWYAEADEVYGAVVDALDSAAA